MIAFRLDYKKEIRKSSFKRQTDRKTSQYFVIYYNTFSKPLFIGIIKCTQLFNPFTIITRMIVYKSKLEIRLIKKSHQGGSKINYTGTDLYKT